MSEEYSLHDLFVGEVTRGNQRSVAVLYAINLGLPAGQREPWPWMNAKIQERWPKGLIRVKALAWKIAKEAAKP